MNKVDRNVRCFSLFENYYTLKAQANGCNIGGQQHAALLGPTCCVRWHGTTTVLALVTRAVRHRVWVSALVLPVHVALKYASLNCMRFGPGYMSFESKQYGGQHRCREPELLF